MSKFKPFVFSKLDYFLVSNIIQIKAEMHLFRPLLSCILFTLSETPKIYDDHSELVSSNNEEASRKNSRKLNYSAELRDVANDCKVFNDSPRDRLQPCGRSTSNCIPMRTGLDGVFTGTPWEIG